MEYIIDDGVTVWIIVVGRNGKICLLVQVYEAAVRAATTYTRNVAADGGQRWSVSETNIHVIVLRVKPEKLGENRMRLYWTCAEYEL